MIFKHERQQAAVLETDPLILYLQRWFYQPSMSSRWTGVFTFNSKVVVPTLVLRFSYFWSLFANVQKVLSKDLDKDGKGMAFYTTSRDLRVVGADKQSVEVTGAFVENGDNVKKWNWENEIAATTGFGRNECVKRRGLRLRSPPVQSPLCDGEPHTPFPGLICKIHVLHQTKGFKTFLC